MKQSIIGIPATITIEPTVYGEEFVYWKLEDSEMIACHALIGYYASKEEATKAAREYYNVFGALKGM
jgi:hypothetical protein